MLPDLDGLSVCQILRAQPSTRDIPVFIISALDDSWAARRGSRARFAKCFTKPMDLRLLSECIRAVPEERQAMLRTGLSDTND